MTPEFSRPERVDTIGERARDVRIEADERERQALARRFDLPSIERLEATLAVRRELAGILVTGRVEAAVIQACIATGEPVSATIDEPVALRFVQARGDAGEEEVELSADAIDTVEFDGGAVDLGDVAADTLALALDPFPRSPDAAEALRTAGVLSDEDAAPVSSLAAALKAKLGG